MPKSFIILTIKGDIMCYEIVLSKKHIDEREWHSFFLMIQKYLGFYRAFKVVIKFEWNLIKYYLVTKTAIPLSLCQGNIYLKKVEKEEKVKGFYKGFYINEFCDNVVSLFNKLRKKDKDLKMLEVKFLNYNEKNGFFIRGYVYYENKRVMLKKRLLFLNPSCLCSVNFDNCKSFSYKKMPNYFDIQKVIGLLDKRDDNALFKVDAFPFLEDDCYIKHNSFSFDKHSLIIGGSGAGKSKFISLLINNISLLNKSDYKIVVIDPHDDIKNNLGGIGETQVIDFKKQGNVDLFRNSIDDINASVELQMIFFKSLMSDSYNSFSERVLRYSIYLLTITNDFSFMNLRKLLLDLDYRNDLIKSLKMEVPTSVLYFFLTDFNDIKNKYYDIAISPIIAFLDEMQMVPIFNESGNMSVKDIVANNFLSIFSLNRLSLGDKTTKSIANLLIEQLFLLAQSKEIKQHLIVIVDEVAVLETPLLEKFLSELRKFNTSIILAGQYFGQISEGLKEAILANTSNYYIFRTSRMDASLLAKGLEIKLKGGTSEDEKINYFTKLKNRECIVRIEKDGVMYPALKCVTMDFKGKEFEDIKYESDKVKQSEEKIKMNFKIDDVDIEKIMRSNSTSRKKME